MMTAFSAFARRTAAWNERLEIASPANGDRIAPDGLGLVARDATSVRRQPVARGQTRTHAAEQCDCERSDVPPCVPIGALCPVGHDAHVHAG